MNSKSLSKFKFESHLVRTLAISDEIWFVAKDVMDALDYAQSSNPARVISHLPEEWKGVNLIHTPGGKQRVACISEQGLYFFLGRSDKPKALPFQKWLAGKVLPSIRKTGSYSLFDATPNTTPTQKQIDLPPITMPLLGNRMGLNGWLTYGELVNIQQLGQAPISLLLRELSLRGYDISAAKMEYSGWRHIAEMACATLESIAREASVMPRRGINVYPNR